MQHMAAAAASRARCVSRREMQRSSGIGPSQVLVFTSPENTSQKTYATSPENFQNLSYVSPEGDSLSGIPSAINIQPPSSVDVNLVSNAAVNRDIPFKPRYAHKTSSPTTMEHSMLSFLLTLFLVASSVSFLNHKFFVYYQIYCYKLDHVVEYLRQLRTQTIMI
jgi:E3 ubiquitin-protein ligase RHF